MTYKVIVYLKNEEMSFPFSLSVTHTYIYTYIHTYIHTYGSGIQWARKGKYGREQGVQFSACSVSMGESVPSCCPVLRSWEGE